MGQKKVEMSKSMLPSVVQWLLSSLYQGLAKRIMKSGPVTSVESYSILLLQPPPPFFEIWKFCIKRRRQFTLVSCSPNPSKYIR